MKPLELTIYPKSRGMFGAQYDLPGGRHMLAREGADVMSRNKRLTDAELAAEAWAAQCNRRVRNYDPTQDIPGVTWEWEHTIMARFATLPHYDQEEAQA